MAAPGHSCCFPMDNTEGFPRYYRSSCNATASLDKTQEEEIHPAADIVAMRKRSVHWTLLDATLDPKIGYAVTRAYRFHTCRMLKKCSSSHRIVGPSVAPSTSIRDCIDEIAFCCLCLLNDVNDKSLQEKAYV